WAEGDVAGVVGERDAAGADRAVADHRVELRHAVNARVEDIDVFGADRPGQRQVGREAATQGHSAAKPRLGPVEVDAVIVVAAGVGADVGAEEVRLREADEVALQDGTGLGFDAESLATAAPGPAGGEIVPARGRVENVEVAFADDD